MNKTMGLGNGQEKKYVLANRFVTFIILSRLGLSFISAILLFLLLSKRTFHFEWLET